MVLHVPSLEKLVHELSRLPGIGTKTAQRLAYHLLKSPLSQSQDMAQAMLAMKEVVVQCRQCYSYTEGEDVCRICNDAHRSNDVICVVEDPSGIARIESSGAFRGKYHVLHGAIAPLEGVRPDDLKIPALVERIEAGSRGQGPIVRELIMALDADLEGDTTVLYIAKILREKQVKITRIAHGVPIGGDIDFVDHRTLGRALENRIQI